MLPGVNLLRALAIRPFAWLWSGQSLSRLGDQVFRTVLAWEVVRLTGSVQAMGTAMILMSLPMVALLLPAGAIADRLPKRNILFVSDALRGILVLLFALCMVVGYWSVRWLYVLVFLFGVADAFFQPSYSAVLPQLVRGPERSSANALTSLSGKFVGVVGPLLSAAVFGLGGAALAFGLDGVTFLVSAGCVLVAVPALRRTGGRASVGVRQMLVDLRQGFAFVIKHQWLVVTMLVWSVINMAIAGCIMVVLPLLVQQQFGLEIIRYATLLTASSAGAVISAAVLGQCRKFSKRGWLQYIFTGLVGLALLLTGSATSLAAATAGMLLFGFSLCSFSLVWVHSLQEYVPQEIYGRVSSLDLLTGMAFEPLGFAIAGSLGALLGAKSMFIWSGVLTMALAAIGVLFPGIRQLD